MMDYILRRQALFLGSAKMMDVFFWVRLMLQSEYILLKILSWDSEIAKYIYKQSNQLMSSGQKGSPMPSSLKTKSIDNFAKLHHFERKPQKNMNTSSTLKRLKPAELQSNRSAQKVVYETVVKADKNHLNTIKKQKILTDKFKKRQHVDRSKKEDESVNKSAQANKDSSEYYKYWKNKANEYQQANFTLSRINSAVQEQNQILKYRYAKLEKQYAKLKQSQFTLPDNRLQFPHIEQYYKNQLEETKKVVEDQRKIILKQEKKITQLSRYVSQNHNLKSILGNLEERMNTMSRQNSTQRSVESSFDSKQHLRTYGELKSKRLFQHKSSNPLTQRPKESGDSQMEKWDKYSKTNYHD